MTFLLLHRNNVHLIMKLTMFRPTKFIYLVCMYVAEPPNIASFKTCTTIIFSVTALNNTIIIVEVKLWTFHIPMSFQMQTQ